MQHLPHNAVEHMRAKGRLRKAVLAQHRGRMAGKTVHGLGIKRKMPPHVATVAQQKIADILQTQGHALCGIGLPKPGDKNIHNRFK